MGFRKNETQSSHNFPPLQAFPEKNRSLISLNIKQKKGFKPRFFFLRRKICHAVQVFATKFSNLRPYRGETMPRSLF